MFRRVVPLLLWALVPVMGADIPRQSPEFVIKLPPAGKQLLLSQFQGKVVVLEFLLTTCPHCQFTSRTLEKLYKEYGPQGFQVIGVATNEMANMLIPDFVKNNGLTFPVGWVQSDASYQYLQHPMMLRMYMPQVVLLDRKGVIRAQYSGEDKFFSETEQEKNLRAEILKMLKEPHKVAAKKGGS